MMRNISVRIAIKMAINPGINLAHFVENGAMKRGSFFWMDV
jgi:hypothetical protein